MYTKVAVYRACVVSVLLYGTKTWILYSRQEFHLNCLRRILDIDWPVHVAIAVVLTHTHLLSQYALFQQSWLHWLGHVHHMPDGMIPKVLLYGELPRGHEGVLIFVSRTSAKGT